MKRVAIIGGGGWGTALSIALARMGHRIRLWVYEPELVPAINAGRSNPLYLSDFRSPIQSSPQIRWHLVWKGPKSS